MLEGPVHSCPIEQLKCPHRFVVVYYKNGARKMTINTLEIIVQDKEDLFPSKSNWAMQQAPKL